MSKAKKLAPAVEEWREQGRTRIVVDVPVLHPCGPAITYQRVEYILDRQHWPIVEDCLSKLSPDDFIPF